MRIQPISMRREPTLQWFFQCVYCSTMDVTVDGEAP